MSDKVNDVDRMMHRLRAIGAGEAESSGLVPLLAALVKKLDRIDGHLVSIDNRVDELTAEVSLQRAALERFGFMRKRPTPPQGGDWPGGDTAPIAAKGTE